MEGTTTKKDDDILELMQKLSVIQKKYDNFIAERKKCIQDYVKRIMGLYEQYNSVIHDLNKIRSEVNFNEPMEMNFIFNKPHPIEVYNTGCLYFKITFEDEPVSAETNINNKYVIKYITNITIDISDANNDITEKSLYILSIEPDYSEKSNHVVILENHPYVGNKTNINDISEYTFKKILHLLDIFINDMRNRITNLFFDKQKEIIVKAIKNYENKIHIMQQDTI